MPTRGALDLFRSREHLILARRGVQLLAGAASEHRGFEIAFDTTELAFLTWLTECGLAEWGLAEWVWRSGLAWLTG